MRCFRSKKLRMVWFGCRMVGGGRWTDNISGTLMFYFVRTCESSLSDFVLTFSRGKGIVSGAKKASFPSKRA